MDEALAGVEAAAVVGAGVVAAGVHVQNMLEEVVEDTVEIVVVSVGSSPAGAGGNLAGAVGMPGVADAEHAVAGGRTAAWDKSVLGADEQCRLKDLQQMQHNPYLNELRWVLSVKMVQSYK